MDRDYFLNAGIQPSLHFEPAAMTTWKSLSSPVELNCPAEQSPGCFLIPSWDKPAEQYSQFESALSSMVSSPVASNSAMSNDTHAIRELIGKLGNICYSGDISPESHLLLAAPYIGGGTDSSNTSRYSTPMNSPPKLHLPIMDRAVKEHRLANSVNSMPMNPTLPAVSAADPAFAERAAKFSCFGSRSFNDRTNQFGVRNAEFSRGSNALMGGPILPRVSSSPVLKAAGLSIGIHENNNSEQTQMELRPANGLGMAIDKKFRKLNSPSALDRTELATSNEESSVSEQIPTGETGLKTPTDSNSRKRKSVSRGKSKEMTSSQSSTKVAEAEGDSNSKRAKLTENGGNENKAGEKRKGNVNGGGDEDQKQAKSNPKPPEPPRDYIHVRARRGQATDSHSLAERVRREKISERMKLLQDLVPGCNKVTGKALMLDEIINYVQSLQRQVEFLSMKLASVNSTLDFNVDGLTQKDIYQPSSSLPPSIYPLDTSASPFYGHQPHQSSTQLHANVSNAAITQCAVDPLDTTTLCRNIGGQLPPVDAFVEGLPQFQTFCQGDLQSIVHMSIGQHPSHDTSPPSQGFPGSNQASQMKLEL